MKKDIPFEISKLTRVLEIIKEGKDVLETGGTLLNSVKARASYLNSGEGGLKVKGAKKAWMAMHFEKASQPNAEYPEWGPFFPEIKSFFYAESDQRLGAWVLDSPGFLLSVFSKKKPQNLETMMNIVEDALRTDRWNLIQERTQFSSQFEVSVFRKRELQRTVVMLNFGPLKCISMLEERVRATSEVV